MANEIIRKRESWLSLVAETAGVSGVTSARIELEMPVGSRVWARTLRGHVQIVTPSGEVVGETTIVAPVEDFWDGLSVQVDCDLTSAIGSRVIAQVEQVGTRSTDRAHGPLLLMAAHEFEPARAMKLMLRSVAAPPRTRVRTPSVATRDAA